MTTNGKEPAVSQGVGAPRSDAPPLPERHDLPVTPMDEGLEAFLRMLGHLAGDAVLRDLGATLGLPPVSIETPRGIDRTPRVRGRKKTR